MDLIPFGTTELRVAPVCLGAMNFGTPGWGCDEAEAARIVAVYRDAGGNFFDTANVYGGGESERILGRLVGADRQRVVIASKVGFPSPDGGGGGGLSPKNIRSSLVATLGRLGTQYLDLFQIHAFDPTVPAEEYLGELNALVTEGLIRYAGCSNYFVWQIAVSAAVAERNGWQSLASAQMMYSLIRRDLEREHFGYAEATGLALIAYSPLHGGQLASAWRSPAELPGDSRAVSQRDVYLSDADRVFGVTGALVEHADRVGATPGQVALGWVLRQPAITATLTAAQSATELESQLAALSLDADESFWDSLDAATALPPSYPADFYARLKAR